MPKLGRSDTQTRHSFARIVRASNTRIVRLEHSDTRMFVHSDLRKAEADAYPWTFAEPLGSLDAPTLGCSDTTNH